MNQSPQLNAARRHALGILLAALALGLLVAGCGSSKPATTKAGPTSAAVTPTQTTPNASTQQGKRLAAARHRARVAAATRARHARAARLKAQHAAAALAAQMHAAAARQKAQQAAARKQAKSKSKSKTTTQPKTTTGPAASPPKATGAIVSVNTTSLGSVLISSKGLTLYLFEKDSPGQSACSGSCAGVWPPLTTKGTPVAGQGASKSELGTIRRAGGVLQVTYGGRPLYLYVGDTHGGQTTGEGLNQFGALWWAVSAAGQKVTH
jgi:predicted lipoprotein with Yx(FWY)xxD motif